MTLNFFTIIDEDGSKSPRRIRLTQSANDILRQEFKRQRLAFLPKDTDLLPFTPGYKPDADEIFRIANYTLPTFLSPILAAAQSIPDVRLHAVETSTKAIVAAEQFASGPRRGQVSLYFQRFDRRQLLKREGVISFLIRDDSVFNTLDDQGIQLAPRLAAAHFDGDLYFRSAWGLRGFLDVEAIYSEATDDDVRQFVSDSVYSHLDDDAVLALFKGPDMRRRLAAAQGRELLESVGPRRLQSEAHKFGFDLRIKRTSQGEQLVLPGTRAELKKLLQLLNDDLLESDLTSNRYTVNSKRGISP